MPVPGASSTPKAGGTPTPGPTAEPGNPVEIQPVPAPSASFAALVYTGVPDSGSPAFYPDQDNTVAGEDGICQTVTLPANATLSFSAFDGGDESSVFFGDQEADIIVGPLSAPTQVVSLQAQLLEDFGTANPAVPTGSPAPVASPQTWANYGPIPLIGLGSPALMAGQTVTLYFGVYDTEPGGSSNSSSIPPNTNKLEAAFGEYRAVDNVVLGVSSDQTSAVHRAKTSGSIR